MDETEAEALMEALGSSLNWVRSRSWLAVEEDVEPDTARYFLLGFVAMEMGSEARHRFVIRPATTTAHWTASVFPERRKTQIRARRKTLAEAKAACEHHLKTGNWENVDPEVSLEWCARDGREGLGTAWKNRLLYRTVGRNLQYRVLEQRWLHFFRRYFVICDAHQCVRSGKRVVTREQGYADASVPDCMAGIESRRFWFVADAKAACERHHAMGEWG